MEKFVVASGWRYADIDILACIISYKELLQKERKEVITLLPDSFNKSITGEIKSWIPNYNTHYQPEGGDKFIVVDLSEPEYINPAVDQNKIVEIYDHHFGYEDYWKKRLGKNSKIEKVGACATLIWEEYKKRGFAKGITQLSARLIVAAIISNTLNFKASVTTKRDVDAYNELKNIAKLPDNWRKKYFEEQEKSVFENPQKEIINDTHVEKFPGTEEVLIIGQVELWDSRKFIKNYKDDIKKALESFKSPLWFLTSPSISEGKNYIYTESEKVKKLLTEKLDTKFMGDIGTTDKLYLRKEIKRTIYNY